MSVILLDSVINVDKIYYPQTILKQYKYAVKKEKIINTINEELDLDESFDESNKRDED